MKNLLCLIVLILVIGRASSLYAQDRSIDSLKHALATYDKKPASRADTVKIQILKTLVSVLYENQPAEAFRYAKEELELSKKIGYKPGMADAYNGFGAVYDQKSHYHKALLYYKKALKITIETGDRVGQQDCYNNIGITYTKLANYSVALQYMLKGLAIAKHIKEDYFIAACYNNIGVLYMSQKNYDAALKNYLSCLKIFRRINNVAAVSVIEQNIGEIYHLQGKPDLALRYLNSGLKLAKSSGNVYSEANNYYAIGLVQQQKKQYDAALGNFTSALTLRQSIDDGHGTAESYLQIGNVYFQKGDKQKAISNVNKGLALVKISGELALQQTAYQYLSDIYSSIGNYKHAFENYQKYKQITDSIFNLEKDKKIVQVQLQYDFKIAQDSLKDIQQKKTALLHQEAQEQRETRNFTYIVMVLIVVFLVILLWQRNNMAKVKRKQVLEEQRNRISRDLHDNLGAQLSAARMFMVSLSDSEGKNIPEIAGNSISLLDASIADLRNVMDDMQDSVLVQKGYLAATEELINKVNKLNNIEFSLTHHKMDERLHEKVEHELYRVTQELINNTLKYSHAKQVSIDLLRSNDSIVLMYEDDGVGYDLKTVKRGYGLRNIESRIRSLGGKVNFDSMPGAGARTIIEIPQ